MGGQVFVHGPTIWLLCHPGHFTQSTEHRAQTWLPWVFPWARSFVPLLPTQPLSFHSQAQVVVPLAVGGSHD